MMNHNGTLKLISFSMITCVSLLSGCGCSGGNTRHETSEFESSSNKTLEHSFLESSSESTTNNTVDTTQFPYTFTDSTGTEITLNEQPTTVAVLFSSYAEIWTLAGGEVDITVGETIERGFTDDTVLLVDDGAGKTIDNELLVSYKPDFVICSSDIAAQKETAELLQSIHTIDIPCAQFQVDCFDDYLSMLKICTDITGNSEAYETYGLEISASIDSIIEKVKEAQVEKEILFIRSGSSSSSAKAKTATQHFAAKMLEDLGCYNIADNAPVLLDGLSLEEILQEDPDCIFISTMGDENAAKAYMDGVLSEPTWQALTAISESNYFYLPKDLFQFKPNARWNEAYQYLAKLLYPEIDFDVQ